MRVSVELPDQKASGLDAALAKQFADLQRQLMGLVKEQTASKSQMHSMLMTGMAEQRDSLLQAMERLMGMVGTSLKSHAPTDAMASALQGLKQTLASLPDTLKAALNTQYQGMQERSMKVSVKPQVTVRLPEGLTNRLDSLETALLTGMHRSRNRTFGSNY